MRTIYETPIGPHKWVYRLTNLSARTATSALEEAFGYAHDRACRRFGALYVRPELDLAQRAWIEREFDGMFQGVIDFLTSPDSHDEALSRAAEHLAHLVEAENRLTRPALRVVGRAA